MNGWRQTRVSRRLGLALPIVQGPFGGGLSSVALVAAVSEAGGLGSFGVHHLGGAAIEEVARAIRARTSGPFALNLWLPHREAGVAEPGEAEFEAGRQALRPWFEALGVPLPERPARVLPDFAEQMEAVLRARPAVFSFVYGVPPAEVLERCREREILTIGTATHPDEAIALERAGVDLVVASGFEAGGHRVSFLRRPEDSLLGSLALIPQVVDAVSVPVIAAGGIADGRGIAAALTLGAEAVQIGTAFLACEESGTSALHRDRLFGAEARDTALTRVYSGRLARGIRNRLMEEGENLAHAPYPLQGWLTGPLKQAALEAGRADLIPLWCGQAAPLLRHRRADALLRELVEGTEVAFLRQVGNHLG